MSSANPFRASQAYKQSTSSPIPQASFINTDSSVPEARRDSDYVLEDSVSPPPKTKKHVRILSPTTSISPHPDPDAGDVDDTLYAPPVQRPSQSQHAGSPLPLAPAGFPNNSVTEGGSNAQDAHMLPSSGPYPEKPQAALSPSNVPANPFSKTLAELEPQERGSGQSRAGTEGTTRGNNGASLDVESFKNLLMTGKPTPRPSASPSHSTIAPNPLGGPQFESSSSTDTSSISRQSLFEPPHESHAETPRTSYEMADSDGDENMGLVSEVKKGKKKPPPAPKPRHGKPVTPRQPQVVSFDSFAATSPTTSPIVKPRDNSDVNKPLPPTPVVSPSALHISTQDTTPYQPSPETSAPADIPTPRKKIPPPVPLARRQSQLRTSTTASRPRNSVSLKTSPQQSTDALPSPVPSNHDPISSVKSRPPPPPSRHGARLANASTTTSSANSSTTELPQRSASVRSSTSARGPTSSRRSTLDSEPIPPGSGVNRTSSVSSNRNTSRAVSNESTGSVMPPPPPPPRRNKSNRSSLDQQRPYMPSSSPTESRRTSTEYKRTSLDNTRRTSTTSESSLRREYAPAEEKGGNEYALYSPQEEREDTLGAGASLEGTRSDSNNILDDMEKFQREIDELRNRYKQAG